MSAALTDIAGSSSATGYAALRSGARALLERDGLPTIKHEDWRYTPTREVTEATWSFAQPSSGAENIGRLDPESIQVVFVNGFLAGSFPGNLPAGLRISSLATESSLVGSVTGFGTHGFSALNTATFSDGVLVEVLEGAVIERTVEIVFVSRGEGLLACPRTFVRVGAGGSIKLIERYISDSGAKNLTLSVTEVDVQRGASLEHVRIQDENESGYSVALWATTQAEESVCEAYNVAFGGSIARLDQNILINGSHATSRLDGVVVSDGTQLIDNHTALDHAVPDCKSYEIYKQIANGASTIVFNGKIFVRQDAQKTDAKQTNQAILLSPKATVNSKPQLEIFADDVKCTHGATVGQLEDLPLFYMRSRGIPQTVAQAILVYAFAAEVIELITIEPVRKHLEERLFEKLGIRPQE